MVDDVYYTSDEVCEMLSLGRRQLEYLVQSRRIPVTKVGRLNRFSRNELDAWIRANSREAHA